MATSKKEEQNTAPDLQSEEIPDEVHWRALTGMWAPRSVSGDRERLDEVMAKDIEINKKKRKEWDDEMKLKRTKSEKYDKDWEAKHSKSLSEKDSKI